MATTAMYALYAGTPKYGVYSITLYRTEAEAYEALIGYLQIGHEDDPDYADEAIPTDREEAIEWCEQKAEDEGTDFYCTPVDAPKGDA